MRCYAILNPVAGKGRLAQIEGKLRETFERLDIEGELVKTISPGDASHLARIGLKKGYSTFLCIGGDGTLHEIINGVRDAAVTIGILPIGERNLFARVLGFEEQSLQQILGAYAHSPHSVTSDVGCINETLFINNIGFGLCVETLLAKQEKRSTQIRKSSLWRSLQKSYQKPEPQPIRIVIDRSATLESHAYDIQIANSSHFFYHHGKSHISFHDRLLDLFLLDNSISVQAAKAIAKTHMLTNTQAMTHARARQIVITHPLDLMMQIDGEIQKVTAPLKCTLAPFQLRFLQIPH